MVTILEASDCQPRDYKRPSLHAWADELKSCDGCGEHKGRARLVCQSRLGAHYSDSSIMCCCSIWHAYRFLCYFHTQISKTNMCTSHRESCVGPCPKLISSTVGPRSSPGSASLNYFRADGGASHSLKLAKPRPSARDGTTAPLDLQRHVARHCSVSWLLCQVRSQLNPGVNGLLADGAIGAHAVSRRR